MHALTRLIFQSPAHRLHHALRSHLLLQQTTVSLWNREPHSLLSASSSNTILGSHCMPPGVHVLAPPAAMPATSLPSKLYSTLSPRRLPQVRKNFSLRSRSTASASGNMQHVFCGCVAEFGVLRLHCARDYQAGMLAWPPRHHYDDACHPRRGGSPSEETGTLLFCDARLGGIDITHGLSNRDGGVSTPHPQGAPCAIHAWRLFFCPFLP